MKRLKATSEAEGVQKR